MDDTAGFEAFLSLLISCGMMGGFVAFVGVILYAIHQNDRRIRTAWQKFATDHGLTVRNNGTMIALDGAWRGVPVRIEMIVRGTGKQQRRYTRAGANFEAILPPGMFLGPEDFFSTIGNSLGFTDIQIGDAAFDGRYKIKGQDERGVRDFFQRSNVRETIDRLAAGGRRPFVESGWLGAEVQGIQSDPRVLGALADAVVDVTTGFKAQT